MTISRKHALAAAAALAAAFPALGATTTTPPPAPARTTVARTAATAPAKTPAARPAPAPAPSLAARPSSAAVPLPPAPAGTALAPRGLRPWFAGARAGIASPRGNGGDSGFALVLEGATPWKTTASGLDLAWVVPLRTIVLSSERAGLKSGGVAFELSPALRTSVALSRTISFRTDVGAGVVSRLGWTQVDVTFVGRKTETSNKTTGLARIGAGFDWAVKPNLAIAIEPLSLGYDFDGNADWIFAAGATYRM